MQYKIIRTLMAAVMGTCYVPNIFEPFHTCIQNLNPTYSYEPCRL